MKILIKSMGMYQMMLYTQTTPAQPLHRMGKGDQRRHDWKRREEGAGGQGTHQPQPRILVKPQSA